MLKADLKQIQVFLEQQGMKSVLILKSDGQPVDQLFVALGVDGKERDLVLQLKIIEETLPEESQSVCTIHFFCALPFRVPEQHAGEVARLILLLNKSFGLPGFEFSEVDGVIYFRTVVPAVKEVAESIVIVVIGNLMSNVDTFASTLEKVAEGKATLHDIVEAAKSNQ